MFYAYQDFSKNDKKQLVRLYELGVQREIERFLKASLMQHQEMVLKHHEDIRPAYWKIADSFNNFSKHLRQVYDNTGHRYYPNVICRLLNEEHLMESDLEGFSQQGLGQIQTMLASFRSLE